MKLVDTPTATPNTPSVVSHMWLMPLDERGAAVGDDLGHVGAEEDVDEEHRSQDHHRQAERAPRGLEQQQHADHGGGQVQVGGHARALRELL